MNPLETYLKELSEIRASGAGVKETSYYGPLATLNLTNRAAQICQEVSTTNMHLSLTDKASKAMAMVVLEK